MSTSNHERSAFLTFDTTSIVNNNHSKLLARKASHIIQSTFATAQALCRVAAHCSRLYAALWYTFCTSSWSSSAAMKAPTFSSSSLPSGTSIVLLGLRRTSVAAHL